MPLRKLSEERGSKQSQMMRKKRKRSLRSKLRRLRLLNQLLLTSRRK